jgi:hypothetical protein
MYVLNGNLITWSNERSFSPFYFSADTVDCNRTRATSRVFWASASRLVSAAPCAEHGVREWRRRRLASLGQACDWRGLVIARWMRWRLGWSVLAQLALPFSERKRAPYPCLVIHPISRAVACCHVNVFVFFPCERFISRKSDDTPGAWEANKWVYCSARRFSWDEITSRSSFTYCSMAFMSSWARCVTALGRTKVQRTT